MNTKAPSLQADDPAWRVKVCTEAREGCAMDIEAWSQVFSCNDGKYNPNLYAKEAGRRQFSNSDVLSAQLLKFLSDLLYNVAKINFEEGELVSIPRAGELVMMPRLEPPAGVKPEIGNAEWRRLLFIDSRERVGARIGEWTKIFILKENKRNESIASKEKGRKKVNKSDLLASQLLKFLDHVGYDVKQAYFKDGELIGIPKFSVKEKGAGGHKAAGKSC